MSEADAALTDQKSASRRGVAARREPDAVDRRLINALQGDFPLLEAPFAAVGASLGLSEDEVIQRLQALLDDHVLTRFGPMFQIERMGGAFCLALPTASRPARSAVISA